MQRQSSESRASPEQPFTCPSATPSPTHDQPTNYPSTHPPIPHQPINPPTHDRPPPITRPSPLLGQFITIHISHLTQKLATLRAAFIRAAAERECGGVGACAPCDDQETDGERGKSFDANTKGVLSVKNNADAEGGSGGVGSEMGSTDAASGGDGVSNNGAGELVVSDGMKAPEGSATGGDAVEGDTTERPGDAAMRLLVGLIAGRQVKYFVNLTNGVEALGRLVRECGVPLSEVGCTTRHRAASLRASHRVAFDAPHRILTHRFFSTCPAHPSISSHSTPSPRIRGGVRANPVKPLRGARP